MGLIRNFHLSRALDRLYDSLSPLTQENANMKSIFASKTFWVNALMAGASVLGYLPNNKYTIPALAGINWVLRYITTGPVSLTGS